MLVWYRPQPNEVNFSPWLEGYLSARRRKRQCLYGSALGMVMLSVGALVWLYFNLLQAQAGVHRNMAQGAQHLQVQQAFDAWWPVHQLSRVLITLQPYQQLVSWQWQSINTRDSWCTGHHASNAC